MSEHTKVPDKDAKDILREWEEAGDEAEVFDWHSHPVHGHDE